MYLYVSKNFSLTKTYIYVGWEHNKFTQRIYMSAGSESVNLSLMVYLRI